ncbi:MAG: NTP transferase domain-containing protein [Acidimicrobiales bacterium]
MAAEPAPGCDDEMGLPPVCILAGGLGSRLGELVGETPKPVLPVAGRPFLSHVLEDLATQGCRSVVLCVGYLGEKVRSHFGDEQFGMRIAYSFDGPAPMGTLGAVRRAAGLLGSRFLVMYGDTILTVPLRGLVAEWDRSGLPAVMAVLHNEDRWGRSNCIVRDGRVLHHDKGDRRPGTEWIDYGISGLSADTLGLISASESDLSALLGALAVAGSLAAFPVVERFYEIGTPASLEEAERFLIERASARARQTRGPEIGWGNVPHGWSGGGGRTPDRGAGDGTGRPH